MIYLIMKKNVIGIIGTGNIGSRVALQLSKDSIVYGYDIVQEKVNKIKHQNFKAVNSNIDIAKNCNIIFLSLPGPDEVLKTLSIDGILDYLKAGTIIVDLSTSYPETQVYLYDLLATKNVYFLEMPVSGGITAAKNGNLSAFVSGDENIYNELESTLDYFSKSRTYFGELGKATFAKLINNRIAILNSFMLSEAIITGRKNGISDTLLLESIQASSGNNAQIQRLGETIFSGNYLNGFPSRLAVKDLKLINKLEKSLNISSGGTIDALKMYQVSAKENSELDFSIVVKLLEEKLA